MLPLYPTFIRTRCIKRSLYSGRWLSAGSQLSTNLLWCSLQIRQQTRYIKHYPWLFLHFNSDSARKSRSRQIDPPLSIRTSRVRNGNPYLPQAGNKSTWWSTPARNYTPPSWDHISSSSILSMSPAPKSISLVLHPTLEPSTLLFPMLTLSTRPFHPPPSYTSPSSCIEPHSCCLC